MNKQFQSGQTVMLNSSQGPISRVVVMDLGDVLAVCLKEEIEVAKAQGRQPLTVGFKKRDIIGREKP